MFCLTVLLVIWQWRYKKTIRSENHSNNKWTYMYKYSYSSFQSQWKNNNGKCGLCGDPWNKPRDHEFGGKYFTNHISSTYQKGSVINLTVFTNLNPSGWMEFRLLPYDTGISSISNNYLLHIGDSRTRRYRVRRSGYHVIPVRLPTDVECERCILQWKFHTGIRCYGFILSKRVINQWKRRLPPWPTPSTTSTTTTAKKKYVY